MTSARTSQQIAERIAFLERYSTGTEDWYTWVADRLQLQPGMHVLDVGAGNGELWLRVSQEITDKLSLRLVDVSEEVLHEARERLKAHYLDIKTDVGNVTCPPGKPGSVDTLVAAFVLHFVENRREALESFFQLVKTGGVCAVATQGRDHLRELGLLLGRAGFHGLGDLFRAQLRFPLENAGGQIASVFPNLALHRFRGKLELNEAGPVLEFVRGYDANPSENEAKYAALHRLIVEEIKTKGAFRITKDSGLFVARKSF